jgi:putative ABC transport system permease protein
MLRQSVRKLRRSPAFTLTSILVLAVGIGATSAIYSVIHGVLLQPLPYPQPDRLIALTHRADGTGQVRLPASAAIYFTYRDHGRAFESVALWAADTVTVTGAGAPEEVRSLGSTFELLPMLGVQPAAGRLFAAADDRPGSARTIILSHGYWQRRFGGVPVIGRRMTVDGEPHDVIGVLPPSFRFRRPEPDVLLPLRPNRAVAFVGPLGENGIARLKPTVTLEQASRDVERLIPLVVAGFPAVPGMDHRAAPTRWLHPDLRWLRDTIVGDLGDVLWVLMGTIGMLLLLACANVANLQLVRTESRSHEFAVQAALGASRTRIALELVCENVLVALIGGALGLGLASAALPGLLVMAAAHLPGPMSIAIGWAVILFTGAVSLLCGLLFGLAAAVKHARPAVATALAASGRSVSVNRESQTIRSGLVIAQVAVALVLLVAAGLMIRTFQSLRRVDAGFQPSAAIQTVDLSMPQGMTPDFTVAARRFGEIQERLEAVAGVHAAGFASRVPLVSRGPSAGFFIEHHPPAGATPRQQEFRYVSPRFFETIGTPLVAGRDFTWTDHHATRRVALVSERMARREWGSPSAAIGKRIRMTAAEPWREIVGVVGDIHHESLVEPAPESVYLTLGDPLAPFMSRSVTFVIRSARVGTPGFLDEVQKAVWAVDGSLPLANVQTMSDHYGRAMERTALTLLLLGVTAGMALFMGLVGIYGVISYIVSLRVREIGIRLALGAQVATLRYMLMGRVLALVSVGLVLGLAAAAMLARLMASLVFGVTPHDPATYSLVAAILALTAVGAGYLPARRVTRMDPTSALRAD